MTVIAAVAIGLQATAPDVNYAFSVQGTGTAQAVVHVVKVNLFARALSVDEVEYLRAMRTAGLADPAIVAHLPNGPVLLHGTFSDATAPRLEAVRRAAEAFVTAHGGVLAQTIFVGSADECPARRCTRERPCRSTSPAGVRSRAASEARSRSTPHR